MCCTIYFHYHLSVTALVSALYPPPILALLHPPPLLVPLQYLSILDYELLYRKPTEHERSALQLGSLSVLATHLGIDACGLQTFSHEV